MKSLSDLWLKPGYARGGRSRRTSRFNNARFASGWAAGVEMLESRAMLANNTITCTYVEQGGDFNALYVQLPNDSTNPLSVVVGELNSGNKGDAEFNITFSSKLYLDTPEIAWTTALRPYGVAIGSYGENGSNTTEMYFSDWEISSLYISAINGEQKDDAPGDMGYIDIYDTVLLQTVPYSTEARPGNLSNVVSISAKSISFDHSMPIDPSNGTLSKIASLAADAVAFTSVSSINLNTTGLPFLGSITVNSAAGAGQPFAGDGSLVGPDWGSLGYAAGQSIQISLTGNTPPLYTVVDVIGDTLYIQGAGPGAGVYSNAAVQGLICLSTFETAPDQGLIPQIVANYVSLTTTGDGMTIEGAVAGLYTNKLPATCVLSGQTNNGNITLNVVANTHATTNQTQLNILNAGSGEINLAVNGELVSYTSGNTNLFASAVGLYVTGTNSSIGDDTAYPAPIMTQGSITGVPLSLTVYAENPAAICITDVTTAGVLINSITANQLGQAPTVSSGQVEYNSAPSSTTPSYKPGNAGIQFNASGPIILGSVSATGEASFVGSSILEGEGQSQNIIATNVFLSATGLANYTGSVQFIPGAPDTLLLLSPPAGTTWASLGFALDQTIFISAATSASNNGSFFINGVSSDGLTLTLSSSYAVTAATGVVVIGNGVIGQPGTQANGSSNSISLTTIPYFNAYANNGSIYLSLGGQVNSTASGVIAHSPYGQPASVIIQSQASFLTVEGIFAEGGVASIAMSNGTIFQYGQTTNANGQTTYTPPTLPCITAPTVSLSSPYNIGTSLYPLVIDATSGILLNMTATTATSAGAYIENVDSSGNGVVPSTIGVTTYGGNVYVNNGNHAASTPMLSFTGNILSQAPLTAMPTLTFSNTNGDHGSAGNVIISGLLNVDTIMAGIDVNGQPGSGQIIPINSASSNAIRGAGGTGSVTLIAATGIGIAATSTDPTGLPVIIESVGALTAITNVSDIVFTGVSSQTNTLDLAASTTNGNITATWFGDIVLNNAISISSTDSGATRNVILNSISAPTGTVTLTAAGDLVNDGSYGISANALTLTIAGAIGSSSNPVQITTASTLSASAGVGAIWVKSNTALTVNGAVASDGPLSITAMGDIILTDNVNGTTTSLTATNGTVTQTGGTIGTTTTTKLTIDANSIGATTGVIQTNAPTINVTANDGGIYLSNKNSSNLLLTAAAIGTAPSTATDNTTANTVEIYSAGTIELLQTSTALTQLASPLPMGIFNPGGDLTLVAGKTMSLSGTVSGASYQTITSSASTALATCSANSYGGGTVSGGTVTSAGSGYLSIPTVTITGGGGSGATATATLSVGKVTGITITNPGTGYTSAPTVTISPPGDDVYTGTFAINGSSVASSFPSLVIISGTAEISPTTTSTGIPALVTLPDLTAFAAASGSASGLTLDNVTYYGTVSLLNGVGTETISTVTTVTTVDGVSFFTKATTLTITAPQGQGVTIGYLGQNGNAGTATIPNGWSLVINAPQGSVVFLNMEDTIATTGGGTITINAGTDVADVAALGNLTTVGGDITISAGGNIALSTLTTGSASSGSFIFVTSTSGAIIFNEDGTNLNAGLTTLTQATSAVSSAQTNDLARAQLNATQVIAAANLTNANLLATYEGTLAQANAQLTLATSLSAAMLSMQTSVSTAQTTYYSDQSINAAQQAKVTNDQNNVTILLALCNQYVVATAVLGSSATAAAVAGASLTLVAGGLIEVPGAAEGSAMAAAAVGILAAGMGVALNGVAIAGAGAQGDLYTANNQLINDLIILVQDESNLAAAAAQVQAARATLTALAAAYGVAFQSYTYSTQMLSQEKTRSAEISAQGSYNEANAIVEVVFASPSQTISSTGAVTINALGSLTITPSTDTALSVWAAANALTLTVDAGGLPVAVTGTTFTAGSGTTFKPVTFTGFPTVNTINGAGNFDLTGTTGVKNTMSLKANKPQAATATLNGTAYSFGGMNSFNYQGGSGDILSVTPLVPSGDQLLIPWSLAVKLSGGAGSPSTLTYHAQDPFVDVTATGTNKGMIVEPEVATVVVANVNQVTVIEQGFENAIGLTNLTYTVPGTVTYNGLPYYATNLLVNGQTSLDGTTPTLTYYSGTIVNLAHQVTAPTNAGQYTVVGSYPGSATWASAAVRKSFTIIAAPASQLVFTQVPSTGTAGSVLPTLTVAIEDAYGNVINTNTSAPTIALDYYPTGGSFASGSTMTVAAVNGVATFNNLTLTTAGTYIFYTFDGSLASATTGSIVISPAAATAVVFTQTPATGLAGSKLASYTAAIKDAYGNTVTTDTSTVTIAVDGGSGGFASGSTLTAKAVRGVATFKNLTLTTSGTYRLTATSGLLASATTGNVVVNAAAASKVVVAQVPATATAGSQLASITATVKDVYGNTVTSNTATRSIVVKSGPGGFTAGSTRTAKAVGGVATFSDLTLTKAGTYTFAVMAGSKTVATTGKIVIEPAAASKLVVTQSPKTATAGAVVPALKVVIEDTYGNVVVSNPSPITITVKTGPVDASFAPSSTLTATAVKGIATFSNLFLNRSGTYTFTATDGSLTSAITRSMVVKAAAASKLVMIQTPSTGGVNSPLGAMRVAVVDAYGNPTPTAKFVTLSISSGPLGGTFASGSTRSVVPVNGVATFTNLKLSKAGTYTLKATAGLWASATSGEIIVSLSPQ